jgi:hypothetical protein
MTPWQERGAVPVLPRGKGRPIRGIRTSCERFGAVEYPLAAAEVGAVASNRRNSEPGRGGAPLAVAA